jgi:IS1 transposase
LLPAQAEDVLELDEVWSFVFIKTAKYWLWTAMCRRTRQIVAFVIGDHSAETCQTDGTRFQQSIVIAIRSAIFGMPIKKSFQTKLIAVLAKTVDRPITGSVGMAPCAKS